MRFTVSQIASILKGKVVGDSNITITSFSSLANARDTDFSFLSNPQYLPQLKFSEAGVVLVNENIDTEKFGKKTTTYIKVENAYESMSVMLEKFSDNSTSFLGIQENVFLHPTAEVGKDSSIASFTYIDEKVKIGNKVSIYPNCYIGKNVSIGNNVTLYSGVKIYNNSVIGNNVILHSGAVIGSDGFGFAPLKSGGFRKIPQLGNVILDDDVEIGANTTIDRATLESTIIGKGVKLDNLVQIGHNVEIGENTVIASQTGISGSVKIGKNCMFGGQVGCVGHITIADGSQFQAQSGIHKKIVPKNSKWAGCYVQPVQRFLRSEAVTHKLPELNDRVEKLEKKVL